MADVDQAIWAFSVPADETMVGATLWRAGDTDGGEAPDATYQFLLAGPEENKIFSSCVFQFGCKEVGDPAEPLAAANRVPVPSANLGAHLYLSASCEGVKDVECPAGHGDVSGYAAVVDLLAADIVLEQTTQPTVSGVEGELATASTLSGTVDLLVHAEDSGSGVYEAVFTVDGVQDGSVVLDENDGHCRNVGQTTDGLPAFLYLRPCPASLSADVPFSTTALSDGIHHLVVSITDAAGNSAVALDRKIDVENPVPPAGVAPASSVKPGPGAKPGPRRLPRARVTFRVAGRDIDKYRTVRFAGRVLGGHVPRGGKRVVLEVRVDGSWLQVRAVKTGAHGRFRTNYGFLFLGPGRWQVRMLCEAQAGYPFATGWSRTVNVRVS